MAENTKIEWADHTFNPWTGCTKVSPACDHCYAESWSKRAGDRVGKWGPGALRVRTTPANWKQPIKWNAEAERLGIRYRVFCASLADVFDNEVAVSWRADLLALINETPHLDWLLLTKRIGNVTRMVREALVELGNGTTAFADSGLPPNVWIGATICNQEEADRDIPKLLEVPAEKRFLSMEPLLGPVDLRGEYLTAKLGAYPFRNLPQEHRTTLIDLIDWVIVGGESGSGARPMHPDWVRSLRSQCQAAGVDFMFKQWGEWEPLDGMDPELRIRTENNPWQRMDGTRGVVRVGKKVAGRLLDGREWNEVPA